MLAHYAASISNYGALSAATLRLAVVTALILTFGNEGYGRGPGTREKEKKGKKTSLRQAWTRLLPRDLGTGDQAVLGDPFLKFHGARFKQGGSYRTYVLKKIRCTLDQRVG